MYSPGRQSTAREASDAQPTLKVAAVARRLGVAPATLRTWARRYGVGPPAHTAGAHRQYTAEDLSRLLVMRRLTLEGVAPAEAARIALSTPVDEHVTTVGAGEPDFSAGIRLVEDAGRVARRTDPEPGPRQPPPAAPAPGRLLAASPEPGDLPADVRRLLAAAQALDAAGLRRQLSGLVETRGVVRAWQEVAAVALEAADHDVAGPAQAPLVRSAVAESLSAVMHAVTAGAPEPSWGGVLLVSAQDEPQTVLLHTMQAALAQRRVASTVLGPRLPHAALQAAVERTQPQIVVLHSGAEVPSEQVAGLAEVEHRTRLLVAGPGWDGVVLPDGAVHATSVPIAVDQVRLAVRH